MHIKTIITLIIAVLCFHITGTAQTPTSGSLKYNVEYESVIGEAYLKDSLLFRSDGTGRWAWDEEDYVLDEVFPYIAEFSWKKKSDKIIITLKNPRFGKTTVDVKIINNTTIKINEYEDKWFDYKVGGRKVK